MTPSPSGVHSWHARSENFRSSKGVSCPCVITCCVATDRPHPLSAARHGAAKGPIRGRGGPRLNESSWKHATQLKLRTAQHTDHPSVVTAAACTEINWPSGSPLSSIGAAALGALCPPQHPSRLFTRSLASHSSSVDLSVAVLLSLVQSLIHRLQFSSLVKVDLYVYWICCGCRSSALTASGNWIDHASTLGQRC